MSRPQISIIILNWNGWKDTIECLESLYQINYPHYDVILVDNSSKDDSIEKIKEYCEGSLKVESPFFKYNLENKPITLLELTKKQLKNINEFLDVPSNKKAMIIKNEKNYGFAEGNNIGIKFALKNLKPDYILLLNNDTVVSVDFLNKLIESLENENKIGIIGPQINYYTEKNKIQTEGWDINWNKGKEYIPQKQPNDSIDVDFIGGCALLFKREVVEQIGFLDKEYFAYWEDADFCLRAKKKGYRSVCNINSKIWHKGTVTSTKITGFNAYYNTRNRFWFMKKYATRKQYNLFKLYFFLCEFWISTAYFLINKKLSEYSYYYNGIKDGLKNKRS